MKVHILQALRVFHLPRTIAGRVAPNGQDEPLMAFPRLGAVRKQLKYRFKNKAHRECTPASLNNLRVRNNPPAFPRRVVAVEKGYSGQVLWSLRRLRPG